MLLSHIADSINQDSEQLVRTNLELKRQKVNKANDFESLTDLYKLSVAQDDFFPVQSPKDSQSLISIQRAKIREEMNLLQIEEKSLDLKLTAANETLGHIHQKPGDEDGASVNRLLLAQDAKDRKVQDLHTAEQRANALEAGLLKAAETNSQTREQMRRMKERTRNLPGLISALRRNVSDSSFVREIDAEMKTSIAAVETILPRLATLDKDRTTLHESLQRKRKDWKQAEASLISQNEQELSRLKSELEDLTKQSESLSQDKSPMDPGKKSALKGKDRNSAEEVQHLDLESLLGNASPSFQQIQTVTQQYGAGKTRGNID